MPQGAVMTLKLFEVLSRIESEEDFKAFFEDLCTYAEIEKMEQRVECAQLLLGGDTYNRIIEKTDISSATLSRVSRCLQYGSGGYSRVLKKIAEENARENGNAD
ncbi:MAG TPA: TrpR-related protein YerC/YecD [Candidatus Limadaptatus stercorigallinarum]|uniref:TrpR-related protein YerC/YecD n=1 Tax=Candidatus Limadaptatus stercorigallinarum TaxID=2840845 RepID=A0A9D1HU15_9FIRM|nr:TrpR-related protein YerC/YecD [Candidatus Limadaptatus stercorigallinarum]